LLPYDIIDKVYESSLFEKLYKKATSELSETGQSINDVEYSTVSKLLKTIIPQVTSGVAHEGQK